MLKLPLLCFIVFYIVNPPAFGWNHFVVFGDSLSDTGNLNPGFGLPPPYFENRISNGPVAVDILADHLKLSARRANQFGQPEGENYAVAGGNAVGNSPQDLNAQITAFRFRHPTGLGSSALYLVLIGGNDLRDARGASTPALGSQQAIDAADAVYQGVQELIQIGARSIAVSNAPDIGSIPETLELESTRPGVSEIARQLTSLFNDRLAQRLSSISRPGVSIRLFDLAKTVETVLGNPAAYNLDNVSQACFDPSSFRFNPGCDFNTYAFFDSIHPTGRLHQIIGNQLIEHVRQFNSISLAGPYLLLLSPD